MQYYPGNLDWHANIGWHGNLDWHANLGWHGNLVYIRFYTNMVW